MSDSYQKAFGEFHTYTKFQGSCTKCGNRLDPKATHYIVRQSKRMLVPIEFKSHKDVKSEIRPEVRLPHRVARVQHTIAFLCDNCMRPMLEIHGPRKG